MTLGGHGPRDMRPRDILQLALRGRISGVKQGYKKVSGVISKN